MAKEGSVAPMERVNIVYKRLRETPRKRWNCRLKLLVMGDFTLAQDDRRVEERDPINVDKGTIMAKFSRLRIWN